MSERMNPAVKAEWLEALRSGKYTQTTGTLYRISAYPETDFAPAKPVGWCCYGVLCDLAAKAGLSISRKSDEDVEYFDGVVDYLPGSVVEWAGLSANDPEADGRSLAHRNDNGVPFGEIADLIEEHL